MLIIAVDPGNEKTGIACLSYDGTLYEKKIVPSQTLEDALMAMVQRAQSDNHVVTHVVCGNGTNHKKLFTVRRSYRRHLPMKHIRRKKRASGIGIIIRRRD
ncbi:hypothetical protein [uncultured Veillonella sp.]|uniref:hypothetical protein n=1 Tax=uncultured Veillonella sp. TaxID=159268 RepID=UPI00258B648D|nr:hypothetical protein [uncultured Veillonella sp.]